MDLLDVCYKSNMRLFRDSPTTLVPGRWKRCPPGAIAYPGWSAFGSQTQDSNEFSDVEPVIGEARGKNGQVIGTTTPGYSGQRFCGDANAWEFGNLLSQQGSLPVDSRGRPACCGAVDPGAVRIDSSGFGTPVRMYYLRTDPATPPVILPSANSNLWTFPGTVDDVRLLSGIPGSTPDSIEPAASYLPFGVGRNVGPFVAFVTGGLSAQELPPQVLTLSLGFQVVSAFRVTVGLVAEIWLMDGSDGNYKQLLAGLVGMSAPGGAGPHRGRLAARTTDPIPVATGDYLFVGFGLSLVDVHLVGHSYHTLLEWEGTDFVTVDNQVVTTTQAVLTLADA